VAIPTAAFYLARFKFLSYGRGRTHFTIGVLQVKFRIGISLCDNLNNSFFKGIKGRMSHNFGNTDLQGTLFF
jgi:hypothetical protein